MSINTELKRLVIRFGDNDFYYAMNALAMFFLSRTADNTNTLPLPTDKAKLVFIINQVFFGCYVMHQNTFEYNGMEKMDEKYIKHMQEYMTVKPEQILVNDEADEYMAKNDWDNGETIYIDIANREHNIF